VDVEASKMMSESIEVPHVPVLMEVADDLVKGAAGRQRRNGGAHNNGMHPTAGQRPSHRELELFRGWVRGG
jgi:hypothetical protein